MSSNLFLALLILPFCSCGQPPGPGSKIVYLPLGNDSVGVSITWYGGKHQPVYIHLHDDETSILQAARPILEKRGGTLIKFMNNGERLISYQIDGLQYRFDPNRIFSQNGIVHTLIRSKRISNRAIEEIGKFAEAFLELIPREARLIVALHNNSEGGLSINSYLDDGEHQMDAREASRRSSADPDDFILTTDQRIYQSLKPYFNIVWQDNEKVRQDGSLSVFFGEKSIPYLNCETQHGHLREAEQMLLAIPTLPYQ